MWDELQGVVTKVDQTPVPYSPDREWFTLAITVTPTRSTDPQPPRTTNNESAKTETERDATDKYPGTEDDGDAEVQEKIQINPVPSETSPSKTFYYTFIVFSAGEFRIGSLEDEPGRSLDEKDELWHAVKLTNAFALLDREVTFEELITFHPQYAGYMSTYNASINDAGFGADWYDSVAFCRWLGEQAGYRESEQAYASPDSLSVEDYPREPNPNANWAPRDWPLNLNCLGFRLPLAAELEVATRAGVRTSHGHGSDDEHFARFAWYQENSDKHVHPPKKRRGSLRGLFDLHGNLFEWTHNWYEGYEDKMVTDPLGPLSGTTRVFRGGDWDSTAASCRAGYRSANVPTARSFLGGFRLALSPSGVSGSEEPASAAEEAEPSGAGTEGASAEQRPEMP